MASALNKEAVVLKASAAKVVEAEQIVKQAIATLSDENREHYSKVWLPQVETALSDLRIHLEWEAEEEEKREC